MTERLGHPLSLTVCKVLGCATCTIGTESIKKLAFRFALRFEKPLSSAPSSGVLHRQGRQLGSLTDFTSARQSARNSHAKDMQRTCKDSQGSGSFGITGKLSLTLRSKAPLKSAAQLSSGDLSVRGLQLQHSLVVEGGQLLPAGSNGGSVAAAAPCFFSFLS